MKKTLDKEIWIKAPIEEVFRRFTVAEAMVEWHGKEVETDPVPGGIYRVVFENGTVILGKFLEVVPNERIKYEAAYGEVGSTVEINFSEANGGTQVKLRQEFSIDQDTSSFSEGWDYFMGLLKKFVER